MPNITLFFPFVFLLQTICQKTPKESDRYEESKKALQAISKVRLSVFPSLHEHHKHTKYDPINQSNQTLKLFQVIQYVL